LAQHYTAFLAVAFLWRAQRTATTATQRRPDANDSTAVDKLAAVVSGTLLLTGLKNNLTFTTCVYWFVKGAALMDL